MNNKSCCRTCPLSPVCLVLNIKPDTPARVPALSYYLFGDGVGSEEHIARHDDNYQKLQLKMKCVQFITTPAWAKESP